jgi:hypothetical protein
MDVQSFLFGTMAGWVVGFFFGYLVLRTFILSVLRKAAQMNQEAQGLPGGNIDGSPPPAPPVHRRRTMHGN